MENRGIGTNLQVAIRAALKAGEEILSIYNNPESDFSVERKADNSPLTIADKRAHEVIVSFLQKTEHPILSEEGKSIDYETRRNWKTLWIVDPLDGTKEFIKRNGEFTVNIALVCEGVPELGVVYIPVKKELYFGTKKGGAFKIVNISHQDGMNFDTIPASATVIPICNNNRAFTVVASRSHLSAETEQYIDGLRCSHPDIEFISIGSSIKICLVAEGCADIYPRFAPTMEWDTAAGHAIVRAAGKEIYMCDEKTPLTYNKSDLLNPWFIVK